MGQLTGALEKLATPELYERNSFFMLGLPVGASSKEIARRKEDIEAEIEMGNASTVFAHYGKVPDEFAIKDAFAALEDPEQKLLFGFFWFWPIEGQPNDGVPTLLQLQKKDFSNLRAIWEDASEAYNDDALRGRHNLAILAYFMAMLAENAGDATADSYWRESIEHWNQLADDDDFWFLVSDHVRKLEDPRLTTGAVRRLRQQLPIFFDQINVTYAEKYARSGETKAAKRHREYMEISQPELDDIDGTTENAFAAFEDQVKRLIEETRERAHQCPEEGLQAADDLLIGCRPAADMAKAMSLEGKEAGLALFTKIVKAIHTCLICYGNKTRDWKQCLSYTRKAYDYAISVDARKILRSDVVSLEVAISGEIAYKLVETLCSAKANTKFDPTSGLSEANHVINEAASLMHEWKDLVKTDGDALRKELSDKFCEFCEVLHLATTNPAFAQNGVSHVIHEEPSLLQEWEDWVKTDNEDIRLVLICIALVLRDIVILYAKKTHDLTGPLDFIRRHLISMANTGEAYQLLKKDIYNLENNCVRLSSPGCLFAIIAGGATVYGIIELFKASLRLLV